MLLLSLLLTVQFTVCKQVVDTYGGAVFCSSSCALQLQDVSCQYNTAQGHGGCLGSKGQALMLQVRPLASRRAGGVASSAVLLIWSCAEVQRGGYPQFRVQLFDI